MRFLIALTLIFSSTVSFAVDEASIAKAFAQAYAQEQAKAQLAQYLNSHPEIVFSKNPQIGSQALKYIGKALAAYGLITAKTDKDRAFAAAQLINNNPKVALIILAVQIVDTAISVGHQRDLARQYERIKQTAFEATKDITAVYSYRYNQQIQLVADFNNTLGLITDLSTQMRSNSLYKMQVGEGSVEAVTSASISEAMQIIFKIEAATEHISQQLTILELTVNPEEIDLPADSKVIWRSLVQQLSANQPLYKKVRATFISVFKAQAAQAFIARADASISAKREAANLYTVCVEAINQHQTFLNLKQESDVDASFLRSCSRRFQLSWSR